MAHINIDGAQNVEVSTPIPSEKTAREQLEIMEEYTRVYRAHSNDNKARREVECLKVIYPRLFRSIEDGDLIAGRLDFLPIGFGSVTSIGGVGHYCVFHKLRALAEQLPTPEERDRVAVLYDFWQDHDVKSIYCQDVLNETTTGRFIDCAYPLMATARLSGMMLDYAKLMRLGIGGLIDSVSMGEQNEFRRACLDALTLFQQVIDRQVESVDTCLQASGLTKERIGELELMRADLIAVRKEPPKTFHQALQLFWLYALVAGCINYGRLDVVLVASNPIR